MPPRKHTRLQKSFNTLLATIFFCGLNVSQSVAEEKKDGFGTTIRIQAGVPSIDWHTTLDLASARVILNLMEGLTAFDGEGHLVPALAEKWTSSTDQKTFTFESWSARAWTTQT